MHWITQGFATTSPPFPCTAVPLPPVFSPLEAPAPHNRESRDQNANDTLGQSSRIGVSDWTWTDGYFHNIFWNRTDLRKLRRDSWTLLQKYLCYRLRRGSCVWKKTVYSWTHGMVNQHCLVCTSCIIMCHHICITKHWGSDMATHLHTLSGASSSKKNMSHRFMTTSDYSNLPLLKYMKETGMNMETGIAILWTFLLIRILHILVTGNLSATNAPVSPASLAPTWSLEGRLAKASWLRGVC